MFTQHEVNKIFAHIPSRTLRQWALDGLYQWSGESEDGRGVHRQFTVMNLYQIGICEVLAGMNIGNYRINRIMTHFFVGDSFQDEKFALERMKQILIIAKLNKFIDGTEGESILTGTFSKEIFIKELIDNLSDYVVVMRIDLEAIKKRVDTFIYQSK